MHDFTECLVGGLIGVAIGAVGTIAVYTVVTEKKKRELLELMDKSPKEEFPSIGDLVHELSPHDIVINDGEIEEKNKVAIRLLVGGDILTDDKNEMDNLVLSLADRVIKALKTEGIDIEPIVEWSFNKEVKECWLEIDVNGRRIFDKINSINLSDRKMSGLVDNIIKFMKCYFKETDM